MKAFSPIDAGAGLQMLASIAWIAQAWLIALVAGQMAAGQVETSAFVMAGAVALIGVLRASLDAAGGRMAFRGARAFLSQARLRIVEALAARPGLDADRPSSGLAASVLTEQAEAITAYKARFRPARLKATFVPLVILACVLSLSWVAALILLVAAPLIPIFMALIGWRAQAASEAQLGEVGNMNRFLLDRLRGMATIRTLKAVDRTAQALRDSAEGVRQRTMNVLRIAFLSSAVLELFAALGVAMMAVYVGFHLLGQLPFGTWSGKLSLSEGLFILLLSPAFFEPLRELSAVWHDRASGEAAQKALDALEGDGRRRLGAAEEGAPVAPVTSAPQVRLEGVRFAHEGRETPVFDALNLSIKAGEHVAVMAPSGGGKSTLIALIAGLAVPETGHIWIDEDLMDDSGAARLRRRMVLIGQAPSVFAGTLRSNVRLGRDMDAAQVDEALRLAGLEAISLRRGVVPVGEGGAGLSGGEASRLGLARLAVRPEAGLILADEPTAHLDRETAAAIMDGLKKLAKGRTLIVATHDPVLAARMDRIIRLSGTAREAAI